ncbi:MAG TPA: hypothetical protein VFO38_02530 [Candidatus Saccharimonadales bacterium]|nr:hypothetical protein [Candidatus Saccharimonadales bacterium]
MITATFTSAQEGEDMPVRLEYDIRGVTVASRLLIDSKIRAVERILGADRNNVQNATDQQKLLLDLGVACAELIALLKAVENYRYPGHPLNGTTSALPDAEAALEDAHSYLEDHAAQGPPLQNIPEGLDPSKPHWRVTPAPLEGIDWSVVGLTDYATG